MAGRHRRQGAGSVANSVANTKGAIGYVEHAYAKQNKLSHVLINKAGNAVAPIAAAFQAAAASAAGSERPVLRSC